VPRKILRALRANRVFCTDKKRIRTENTVTDKYNDSAWVLYKIVDCMRTAFRPHAVDDPRGRLFVRANCGLIKGT
jgi:hypothetical protein